LFGRLPPRLHGEAFTPAQRQTRDHMLLRAVGAAVLGAAALSVIDMGSKRIAQSPPPGTALKVLTPQVAAGSSLTGAELWSSSPLVALVLRRPG
jgi:hypothetical protein